MLHEPLQVVNLHLERPDGITGRGLFLAGLFYLAPGLLDFFFERIDRVLVLVTQFQRRLNFGRVGDDLCVQLAAFLDQTLLVVVRLFDGPEIGACIRNFEKKLVVFFFFF